MFHGEALGAGPSATITGLVAYSGNTPVGAPTNVINGLVGTPFKARITVLNPGSDHADDLFDCRPVPPGLTIDTNAGARGYVIGTPTRAGSYSVTLLAGNTKFRDGMISLPATLVINPDNPDSSEPAPTIVAGPQPQVVAAGGTAAFDVTAGGSAPVSFQWWQGDLPVAGGTLAALTFPHVRLMDAGPFPGYSFAVTLDLKSPLPARQAADTVRDRLDESALGELNHGQAFSPGSQTRWQTCVRPGGLQRADRGEEQCDVDLR